MSENTNSPIRKIPLFSQFSASDIKEIERLVRKVNFPKGKTFIFEGDPSDSAYITTAGRIRIYRTTEEGEEVTIGIFSPYQIIGEMGIIDSSPRSASVEALDDVSALKIGQKTFASYLLKSPKFALNLLQTLTHRLRSLDEHLADLVTKKLAQRTAKALLELSKEEEVVKISQEKLSTLLGTTRTSLNFVLHQFSLLGLIETKHSRIKVFSKEKLSRYC